jgi:hypothetical protein
MAKRPHELDNFDNEETARRGDEVIRRMANTPTEPKSTTPHRQKKKGKLAAGRAAGKSRGGHGA